MASTTEPYVPNDHYYKYDLAWLVKAITSVQEELAQAIDLRTIHYADPIEWDITTQYQANTVVVDNKTGTAYISSKNVPAGVLLTNTDYWNVIFNYNDAINKLMEQFAPNERKNISFASNYKTGDYLWSNASLYKALKDISKGDVIAEGINIELVQYMPDIRAILKDYAGDNRTATLENDTVTVSGDYTLTGGDIHMRGDSIEIAGPVNITGDTVINGALNASESTITGDSIVGGDLSANGNISAVNGDFSGEVTADELDVHGPAHITGNAEINGTITYKDPTNYYIPFRGPNSSYKVPVIDEKYANVKNYGAAGDGVTDDTAAIQAAIDQCDYVYIPNGNYLITSTLLLNKSLKIVGLNATISSNNAISIFNAGTAGQIADIEIEGINLTGINAIGIYLTSTLRVTINSCNFNAIKTAIYCEKTFGTFITNCKITDTEDSSIILDNGTTNSANSNGFFITNVLIDGKNNVTSCILLNRCEGVYIENCELLRQKTALSCPLEHSCRNVLATNCIFDLSTTYNVLIDGDCYNFNFTNCWFGSSDNSGVFISAFAANILFTGCIFVNNNIGAFIRGKKISFTNCNFISNSKSGSGEQDNFIADAANKVKIEGCTFEGADESYINNVNNGINISDSCTNVIITGNSIFGCTGTPVLANIESLINTNNQTQ